jgi:transcriptional regulator with XRE-family HTH domain
MNGRDAYLRQQGERIRKAREWAGMTQDELAVRIAEDIRDGFDYNKISRIENGKQDVTGYQLKVLARHLNQSPLWILSDPAGKFNDTLGVGPPHPEWASPLSLDLGEAAIPRYDRLPLEWSDRPTDNRPPNYQAA